MQVHRSVSRRQLLKTVAVAGAVGMSGAIRSAFAQSRPRIERFGYSETQARAFVARAVFC